MHPAGVPAVPDLCRGCPNNENNKSMSSRVHIPRMVFRCLFLPALLAAAVCGSASAETILVTSSSDAINIGDGCTLREALINANTDSKQGSVECAKGSGIDTIVLPPFYISVSSSMDEESNAALGDLDVLESVVVIGSGQQDSRLNAQKTGRLFDVLAGTLTLRGIQLENGKAAQDGGSVRVASGAAFDGIDVGLVGSVIDALAVNGRGGALYLAPGSIGSLSRSAFIGSKADGLQGAGGAIYCDGCVLAVDTTTFAENLATLEGGAVLVAAGSDASFEYVTVGYGIAPDAAGVKAYADISLDAALFADNGSGSAGDDLTCAGGAGITTAVNSLVEFPAGCTPMAGIMTRADLAVDEHQDLLQEVIHHRFDGQPSSILQWRTLLPAVPVASCAGHVDQHLRAAGAGVDCDIGAFQRPTLATNPMRYTTETNGAPLSVTFGFNGIVPSSATVELRAIGGIGEGCDFPTASEVVTGGANQAFFMVDPDTLFAAPALGRRYRACELEAVVTAGDPALIGMSSGLVRILFEDTSIAAAANISVPGSGNYLEFGTVPVGAGGTSNIYFRPSVTPWNITGLNFEGADAARFSSTASLPMLIDDNGAGRTLPLQCLGGVLGDFDAMLEVTTDNPSFPILVFGLRCRVAHLLSLHVSDNQFAEGESGFLTVSLDSPSVLADPLVVDLLEVAGTADAGLDYEAFAGTVTINPGERSVEIPLSIVDDVVFLEDVETFGARILVEPRDDVALSSSSAVSVQISDNDEPDRGIELTIAGVPTALVPGSELNVELSARNISDVDAATSFDVAFTVDDPVRVRSFVVNRVTVTCAAHREWLIATISDPVAEQAAVDAFDLVCPPLSGGVVNSDDGANLARALRNDAMCSISSDQRSAHCSFSNSVPIGSLVEAAAILEAARMERPPQLDYPGEVVARARGKLGPDDVEVNEAAAYVIKGRPSDSGGALGLLPMLFAGLLALRVRGKKARRSGSRPGRMLGFLPWVIASGASCSRQAGSR